MIILNQRDSDPLADNLAALPRLPRDDGAPVFAEPWQAQAFALAVRLSTQGHFTWKEWAAALAAELKADAERGERDDGSRYYHCWLTALERLVVAKRLSDAAALLWETVRDRHGFSAFARQSAPQLLRWESRYGWTTHGWGQVCEKETSLASVLAALSLAKAAGEVCRLVANQYPQVIR